MTIYTIKQKQSGTGSIHDTASAHYDRDIKFPRRAKFAVVLSNYYGGKGYTTHISESSVIAKSRSLSKDDYSHEIIDSRGNTYDVRSMQLIPIK